MSALSQPELWCVDLVAATPALLAVENNTPHLSDAEVDRAASISDPKLRDEWLAAHIALRLLIVRAGGAEWRRRTFTREERGKPVLPGAPVAFSLSHARGIALIGLARRGVIGVDVERARLVRIDAARRERIREAGAGMAAARLPLGDDAAFLQAWVRLEAFAKAEGCGIGRLLTRLGIMGADAKTHLSAADMRTRGAALAAESPAGTVRDLQLGEGTFAAVAFSGEALQCPVSWLPTEIEAIERLDA